MELSPEVAASIANNRTVVKIIEYRWGFSSGLVSVTLVYQVTYGSGLLQMRREGISAGMKGLVT